MVFFIGITAVFLSVLAFVTFLVFMSQPQQVVLELVFNKPKININFSILDSDQFEGLLPFNEMQRKFVYTAASKAGELESGFVSAISIEEARKILQTMGYAVRDIKEAEIGRENPFTPYYQSATSNFQPAEEDEDFLMNY